MKTFPHFFEKSDPKVNSGNIGDVINVAAVLMKAGDRPRANLLLDRSEAFIASRSEAVRYRVYRWQPIEIQALRGRTDEALAAFRQAIEHGLRGWLWDWPYDPGFESIRDDSRFNAMLEEVRADVTRMRKRLAAEGLASR